MMYYALISRVTRDILLIFPYNPTGINIIKYYICLYYYNRILYTTNSLVLEFNIKSVTNCMPKRLFFFSYFATSQVHLLYYIFKKDYIVRVFKLCHAFIKLSDDSIF